MSPRQVWAIFGQISRDRMIDQMGMAAAYQLAHAGEEVWEQLRKDI